MALSSAPEIEHLQLAPSNQLKFKKISEGFKQCCTRMGALDANGDDFEDLKPVSRRTKHGLDFINQLIQKTHKPDKELQTILSKAQKVIKTFENANSLIKSLILQITYSSWAPAPLTSHEIWLTKNKTIVGSFAVILTTILLQIQQDPVEDSTVYKSTLCPIIEEVCTKSLIAWQQMLHTLTAVDTCRLKLKDFLESKKLNLTPNGKRTIRKSFDPNRLRKLNKKCELNCPSAFSIYSSNFESNGSGTESSGDDLYDSDSFNSEEINLYIKSSYYNGSLYYRNPLRVLYQLGHEQVSWRGIDLVGSEIKLHVLKEGFENLLSLLKTMIQGITVLREISIEEIWKHFSTMDDPLAAFLESKAPGKSNVLEILKIILDRMDLLTVGASTLKRLFQEAKTCIHICYFNLRITRPHGWKGCLPPYDQLSAVAEKLVNSSMPSDRDMGALKVFSVPLTPLRVSNMASWFKNSAYVKIASQMPITIVNGNETIELALQSKQQVFTPSSVKLMSKECSRARTITY